jgi:hypothetical protein
MMQYFTLVATVAGPFRSKKRAIEACEHINDVSSWTEQADGATAVAQVVLLESASDIVARLTKPDVEIRRDEQ